jgi:hypothetical protein
MRARSALRRDRNVHVGGPGGQASFWDLTTYDNVARLGSTVAMRVAFSSVPPADAGADAAPTASERTELVDWVPCGSPNN